jgi:hypothetical protein
LILCLDLDDIAESARDLFRIISSPTSSCKLGFDLFIDDGTKTSSTDFVSLSKGVVYKNIIKSCLDNKNNLLTVAPKTCSSFLKKIKNYLSLTFRK